MVTITYKVKIQDEFVEDFFTSIGQANLTGSEVLKVLYSQNGSVEVSDVDYPDITEEEKEEILRILNECASNDFTDDKSKITIVK